MLEIHYLNYLVKAISVKTGWRVLVLDIASNCAEPPIYQSSAIYSTETEAISSGVQFVQRQQVLSVLWDFLNDCYCSSIITEAELDHLSASLGWFCSFKDSYSDSGYWYC